MTDSKRNIPRPSKPFASYEEDQSINRMGGYQYQNTQSNQRIKRNQNYNKNHEFIGVGIINIQLLGICTVKVKQLIISRWVINSRWRLELIINFIFLELYNNTI